jgi:hypothetical protein
MRPKQFAAIVQGLDQYLPVGCLTGEVMAPWAQQPIGPTKIRE